jgi:hypothetical protein
MMQTVQAALDRLKRLPAPFRGYGRTWSSVALAKEYFRRLAEWGERSGQLQGMMTKDALSLDLAGLLLPELILDPQLVANIEQMKLRGRFARVATHYVRWEAAAGHKAIMATGMWEPYEPLIRLAERGGELSTHHGDIELGNGASISQRLLSDYAQDPLLADLRDGALDAIDRRGEATFTANPA